MPRPLRLYVHYVELANRWIGRFAMQLVFVLGAVLLYATVSRVAFGVPVNWSLEMSQFILSAYYLLGGAYALQNDAHVRMDLFYSRFGPRKRAGIDAFTILFVIFYLGVLFWGGWSSSEYAFTYGQKNYTSWAPLMWPIKFIMTFGIFMMLLQVIATFLRNVAEASGRPIE